MQFLVGYPTMVLSPLDSYWLSSAFLRIGTLVNSYYAQHLTRGATALSMNSSENQLV